MNDQPALLTGEMAFIYQSSDVFYLSIFVRNRHYSVELKFLFKVFSNPSLPHCSNVASIVVVAAPQHAIFNSHSR